jgi:hypothetical protein
MFKSCASLGTTQCAKLGRCKKDENFFPNFDFGVSRPISAIVEIGEMI